MAGWEVLEQIDIAKSAHSGRLILSHKIGSEYDAAVLTFLAALMTAGLDVAWYRRVTGGSPTTLILLSVPLALLWAGFRLVKATARNRDLVRIEGGTDSEGTRAAFTRVAEELHWEKNRNNAHFARYFFGRYVISVLFRPDHVLLNCRRCVVNRMHWPIGLKERDEIVRIVSRAMEAATLSSGPGPH